MMKIILSLLFLLAALHIGESLQCYSSCKEKCSETIECNGSCHNVTTETKGAETQIERSCWEDQEDNKCEKAEIDSVTTTTCFCNEDSCNYIPEVNQPDARDGTNNSGSIPSIRESVLIGVFLFHCFSKALDRAEFL